MKQTIASRLTKLRADQDMSRAAVASFCAMPREQLRRLEQGLTKHPRIDTLQKLARFYNVSVADITGI